MTGTGKTSSELFVVLGIALSRLSGSDRQKALSGPAPQAKRAVAADARGERPTVAVLPFSRTGLPEDFASLGDAIPADIISSLARLRWLRVIARESTFRFRHPEVDLAGLHDVLGANYCLSGRVELLGKQLEVSVDLVDTRNEGLIWSDRFERPVADVHAVRQEIVARSSRHWISESHRPKRRWRAASPSSTWMPGKLITSG
jgi:TolB-like protein